MDFLTVDVGGADLVVEIDQQNATYRPDRSGTSKERAYSGKPMVTVTYPEKGTWSFQTKPLTTDELQALITAAQWPDTITIGGEFQRIDAANTVAQEIDGTLLVEEMTYFGVLDDFLHVAKLTIEED